MISNIHEEFQDRINNLYIVHDEVAKVWKRLDINRRNKRKGGESDDSPVNLFIQGKSGAGKSMAVKKYVKRNKGKTIVNEDNTEIDIKPVIYMTLPVPFTVKGFYNGILKAMGLPARNADVDSIKNQAFGLMKDLGVEMFIIDELDSMLPITYVQRKAAMEIIKDVCNVADVCLVCVGTLESEILRIINSQHIRRYPRTVLRHFDECNVEFRDFIKKIEEQLAAPPGLLDWSEPDSLFPELLHKLTGGLVGWVKPILREAFEIIGVFDEDFNDFDILKQLNGNTLAEAQKNIMGEFPEKDKDKLLADELLLEVDKDSK